ncbi:MAG: amidohydrolase family protein [Bacteroidales bacterium]|nr:amidohydrolase family protein [Bacteroidales bacterium]
MKTYLLHKATIVTAAKEAAGSVIISGGRIADVFYTDDEGYDYKLKVAKDRYPEIETIDLEGKHIIAGGIDAHVHFREPGLTHKADMATESRAAVAGGVTTAFDMPNTNPATVSEEAFAGKMELAKEKSCMNLGFHLGATNTNIEEIERILDGKTSLSPADIKGIKVFMGSSTGNMLVDKNTTLDRLFSIKDKPVLVHCEEEETIRQNLQAAVERYGENIPFSEHENIRSRRACIKSSIKALEKAIQHGTRLVLCHISTKEEIEMVRAAKSNNPDIIAETSCNYLWFCNEDYERMGSRLKCNPSVKTSADRDALREALANGLIDTIGSDHAPHLPAEKEGTYTKAPSGLPSIQQSLPLLLTIAREEEIPLTRIAAVFSENASDLYRLDRGKIKPGYDADIVVFDKEKTFTVRNEDQYSKCGWSPYDGETLYGTIETVFVGGNIIYKDGKFI